MKIFTSLRFLLHIVLIFAMLLSLVPSVAFAADTFEGYGLIVDIDNYITDKTQFSRKGASVASGKYYADTLVTNTSAAPSTAGIEYKFTTDSSVVVNIWLRARATSGSDDSVYLSVDNEGFKAIQLTTSSTNSYIWNKCRTEITLTSGEHTIRLAAREKGARIDQLIITTLKTFIPEGICTEITNSVGKLESKWPVPQVSPPEGQHPRLFFTADRKDEIIANMSAPENANAVSRFNQFANSAITTSTTYSITTLAHIESKALYSYLFDDETARQQAIDAIDLIAQMKPDVSDGLAWRKYGEMILVLAEIYDWCYDDLTTEQKDEIIVLCADFAGNTEIGWPPSKQTAINGHGSEFQFLRDLLAFAIATYDERPDIWNYIGGRFYAEYVPIRQFRLKGQYNLQGTNYGYYRTEADAYAYALITGMGAPEPYLGTDLAGNGYSELYLKRPDGRFLNDGDMYESNTLPATYRTNEKDGMLIKSAATSDGILKGEYFRRSLSYSNGKITQSFADSSPVMQLILSDPSVKVKSFHTLPKSRYFETPVGMMTARTSWEEGRNSDTVMAMMKIGEYYYSNHQHQDSGTFQIYYKGLLAGKGGKYDLYGTPEHNMYTSKTISHNGLLIYDPSEDDGTTNRQNVNDGGQRFENIVSEPLKFGEVLYHEIDPRNTIDPEYTYIKGDITDAYSDKVDTVQRSMMFINLGIEDMPAAFITFDKIISADKTFKKTWVIHGTQKPAVSDNRAVFTAKPSDDGDEVGVMTVDTLLPISDNRQSSVYGSAEDGFGIVNSWKYNSTQKKWQVTKSQNYMPGTDEKDEVNTRRLEISPKTPALEDSFLNVMFIGDNEAKEKAVLQETTSHYGASFFDKAVFFGKTSGANTSFTISTNDNFDYIICDMAKGTYAITDAKGTQTVSASEDGGVLAFHGNGNVSVTKISDTYTAPTDNAVVPGDRIYAKDSTGFAKSLTGGENANAEEFLSNYGYRVEKDNGKYTIHNEETVIAKFNSGDKKAITPRGIFTFINPPREEDGVLRIHSDDLLKIVFDNFVYCDYAQIIFESSPMAEIGPYLLGYVRSSSAGGILAVSAYPYRTYDAALIAAVYQDNEYVGSAVLNKENSYSGQINIADNKKTELRWYFLGSNLMPIGMDVNPQFAQTTAYDKFLTLNGSTKGDDMFQLVSSSYGSAKEFTIKYKGPIATITKQVTDKEAAVSIDMGSIKYSLGDSAEHGYMHYSVIYEATELKSQEEELHIRLRGSLGVLTTYENFVLPRNPGEAYKADVIVDFENAMAYCYINGSLTDTFDISGWETFQGPLHYLVKSSGVTGSVFKLITPTIAVYPKTATLGEIEKTIGNTIYNQTNIKWE